MGAKTDFDIWLCYQDSFKRISDEDKHNASDALPIGVVITKSATGSEFDLTSVLTNPETNEKLLYMNPVMYPKFSILDPTLVYTLPKDQTAYGIADMMTHYFEQYFSISKNVEFLDRMKEGILETIIDNAPAVMDNPEDYIARANLMYAATWSCSSQIITGVIPEWSSHFIEHEVTAINDLNHGLGMAIIMPAWMKYVIDDLPERFAQYGERVWGISREGKTDKEVGLEAIEKTQEFWHSLGIPRTFKEAGMDTSILPEVAKKAVRFGTMGTVKQLEEKDVLEILTLASEE
jgi:alcohol dehydrogenase YqhD (iron-dependent ADH family)